MSVFQKVNRVLRNTWLATIGRFGEKKTDKSMNEITDKSESIIDELIAESASLETELFEKVKLRERLDRRISALNNALGRSDSGNNNDKLLLMSDKVEQITIVVNQLIANRTAEKKNVKKPRKMAVKKTGKNKAESIAMQVSG